MKRFLSRLSHWDSRIARWDKEQALMRRSAAALLALETGLGAVLVSVVFSRFTVHVGSDYAVYYAAARALRVDPSANIYHWSVIHTSMSAVGACSLIPSPFVYPPLLAILLEPLSSLPCASAMYVWEALNALFLSGALYIVSKIWSPPLGTFALFCAATLMSFPLLMGLWFGQVHILILFGLVLALWRYDQGDQIGTGIVLALASLIQVIPSLFFIYCLLRREWRVVIGILVSGILAFIGMLFVVGPQGMLNYAGSIGHSYAINQNTRNASLLYLMGLWPEVVVMIIYLGILWRYRGDQTTGYLWTIVTMILLSPIVWPYFTLWIFPVFLLWWLHDKRWLRALIIAGYVALYFSQAVPAIRVIILLVTWLALGWGYVQSIRVTSRTPSVELAPRWPAAAKSAIVDSGNPI
jgi:hypothetical protein